MAIFRFGDLVLLSFWGGYATLNAKGSAVGTGNTKTGGIAADLERILSGDCRCVEAEGASGEKAERAGKRSGFTFLP